MEEDVSSAGAAADADDLSIAQRLLCNDGFVQHLPDLLFRRFGRRKARLGAVGLVDHVPGKEQDPLRRLGDFCKRALRRAQLGNSRKRRFREVLAHFELTKEIKSITHRTENRYGLIGKRITVALGDCFGTRRGQ